MSSVEKLAELFGREVSTFSHPDLTPKTATRLFNAVTGNSEYLFINDYRVRHYRRLPNIGSKSIQILCETLNIPFQDDSRIPLGNHAISNRLRHVATQLVGAAQSISDVHSTTHHAMDNYFILRDTSGNMYKVSVHPY